MSDKNSVPINPFFIRGEHYAPLDLNQSSRMAFIKGASLTRPIDWDKLKEEWELHYEVTNWQTCGGKLYTTAELYQIFLNQKDKK